MRGIAASRREEVIPGIFRRLGRGRRAFARDRIEIDDRPTDDDAVSAGFAGLSQDRSQGGLTAALPQSSGPRPVRENLRTLSRARPQGLIKPRLHKDTSGDAETRCARADEWRVADDDRVHWVSFVCLWTTSN